MKALLAVLPTNGEVARRNNLRKLSYSFLEALSFRSNHLKEDIMITSTRLKKRPKETQETPDASGSIVVLQNPELGRLLGGITHKKELSEEKVPTAFIQQRWEFD